MSEFRVDKLKNKDGTAGPSIAGITTFSGKSGMQLPVGPTEYRGGRGRGISAGGIDPATLSLMDYVTIATRGNAKDFGDIKVVRKSPAACASSTRGILHGGYAPGYSSDIQYLTISSQGGTYDFGDGVEYSGWGGACASETRGVIAGGWNSHPGNTALNRNLIEYVTIATTGTSNVFGDLTQGRQTDGALASPTRGVWVSGATYTSHPSYSHYKRIDYVTIATTGDAVDFGEESIPGWGSGKCSNSIRGVIGGGYTNTPTGTYSSNTRYITLATKGNSIAFGDLTGLGDRSYIAAMSSQVRGIFSGGGNPNLSNTMEYITIATLGDGTDFGDLIGTRSQHQSLSDSHGGLG